MVPGSLAISAMASKVFFFVIGVIIVHNGVEPFFSSSQGLDQIFLIELVLQNFQLMFDYDYVEDYFMVGITKKLKEYFMISTFVAVNRSSTKKVIAVYTVAVTLNSKSC